MKILFVNEKCGYMGGVEQNVADSAAGLRARGHECYLAYGITTGQEVEKYQDLFGGPSNCFASSELGFASTDQGETSFEAILNRVGPEVIYFHKAERLPSCEHLLSQVHTVRMVHDHDLCCPRRHKYYAISSKVCEHRADWRCWLDLAFVARSGSSPLGITLVSIRRVIKEMKRNYVLDRLLVGSHFMREELLQNGFPTEKVHIIPPVVRLAAQSPKPVPEEPRILFVGQLIRGKGVDLLLRALQQVSVEFSAMIVGAGNAQAGLEDLCRRLGLAGKVQFRGWVGHDELGKIYDSARIVVVPSRWPEPFGMVGVEAMNHGRAVVAFGVGGIPDWLKHEETGLLAPEQDVDALALAVQRLLTDRELAASMGEKGYAYGREHYSFDRYLDRLESHLRGEVSQTS